MKEIRKRIAVQETALDKIIGYIAPVWAARRLRARAYMAYTGGYVGASKSRRALQSWSVTSGDADSDLTPDLETLRVRSRDMMRNTPLACGAVHTVVTNTVGAGLKLQARLDRSVLGMSDEQADAWEDHVEREWRLWSESQECDAARTLNFAAMQELAFRQTLENGDVFCLLPRFARPGSPYYLKLQMIEADRVCNKDYLPDTATLSGGVQKDAFGAPSIYHILEQHPGNRYNYGKLTWKEVPAFGSQTGARNVLHLYRMLRPGQSRGVPYLAPVIESLKQLDRYTETELMAAVVSGLFTVFIKSESGNIGIPELNPDGYGLETTNTASGTQENLKLGNGMIVELAKDQDISTANPGRPNSAFDPFVKAILEQIGVALELPFEVLIHHFTASYSASRAALQEAWRFFRGRRAWLVSNFCQPIYETWLAEAVALGRVPAPGFFTDYRIRKAYCSAIWVGEAPSQLDPEKEVNAAVIRVEKGFSTVDEETVLLTGGDFQDNYPRIAKERKQLEAVGLWQPVSANNPASAAQPKKQEEPEE